MAKTIRTHTPPLAIGMGGSNISLYPLGSPGGFQMYKDNVCGLGKYIERVEK